MKKEKDTNPCYHMLGNDDLVQQIFFTGKKANCCNKARISRRSHNINIAKK
jgi:hypothetical protein